MDLGHGAADADRVVANLAMDGHFIRVVILIELFDTGSVNGAVDGLLRDRGGRTRAMHDWRDCLIIGRNGGVDRTAADPNDADQLLWNGERSCQPERG